MISMPIQQFTSCFYVIPMEYKFFEQKLTEDGKIILEAEKSNAEVEMKDLVENQYDQIL